MCLRFDFYRDTAYRRGISLRGSWHSEVLGKSLGKGERGPEQEEEKEDVSGSMEEKSEDKGEEESQMEDKEKKDLWGKCV